MIHKRFKYGPEDIISYTYSKSAGVFTLKLKNNAVIHYEAKNPEIFLTWLAENNLEHANKVRSIPTLEEGTV